MNAPAVRAVSFSDLFDGLGTPSLAYRPEAATLDDLDVAMAGFVVTAHDPAGGYLLVEMPGVCPDCSPVPVAAVALAWRDTSLADGAGSVPMLVEGRLRVGFAIGADGTASFLRLTDARATPVPAPGP